MSTIAKIMAFIMLVSAIAVASAVFVYQKEANNWKKDHDDLEKSTDMEIANLKLDVSKAVADRKTAEDGQRAASDERNNFKTKYAEYVKQYDEVKKDLADEKARHGQMQTQLTKIRGDLEAFRAENKTLDRQKGEAVDARVAAEKSQRDAEDELTICQDTLRDVRNQLKLTQGKLIASADLNKRYKNVYGDQGVHLTEKADAPIAKINGKVAKADMLVGIIKITVGKGDGVTNGMKFEVVRPGGAGAYIGRIRVIQVADEEAICRIDREMTDKNIIQEGDDVTTRLK